MTTLDEKALKAAKAVEGVPTEYVIRAYLDALPPATKAWAWFSKDNPNRLAWGAIIYDTEWSARDGAEDGDVIVPIEFREVRS